MVKKLKAFTLVELIVALAVLGILMVGIIRMMDPIQTMFTTSSAASQSETVERSIASYIVENVRYATNLSIYKDATSASDAMNKFLAQNPKKRDGTAFTKSELKVICVNNATNFTTTGKAPVSGEKTFRGRLIAKIDGQENFNESQPFDYTGTDGTGSYMVFGDAYYGTGDYYIRLENFGGGTFDVVVESDYYYTKTKNKGHSRVDPSSTNDYSKYTVMTVSMPNASVVMEDVTPVFSTDIPTGFVPTLRTTPINYYIVYTIED